MRIRGGGRGFVGMRFVGSTTSSSGDGFTGEKRYKHEWLRPDSDRYYGTLKIYGMLSRVTTENGKEKIIGLTHDEVKQLTFDKLDGLVYNINGVNEFKINIINEKVLKIIETPTESEKTKAIELTDDSDNFKEGDILTTKNENNKDIYGKIVIEPSVKLTLIANSGTFYGTRKANIAAIISTIKQLYTKIPTGDTDYIIDIVYQSQFFGIIYLNKNEMNPDNPDTEIILKPNSVKFIKKNKRSKAYILMNSAASALKGLKDGDEFDSFEFDDEDFKQNIVKTFNTFDIRQKSLNPPILTEVLTVKKKKR